jgi:hypothetical protein
MSRRVGSANAENTRDSGSALDVAIPASLFNQSVDYRMTQAAGVVNLSVEYRLIAY